MNKKTIIIGSVIAVLGVGLLSIQKTISYFKEEYRSSIAEEYSRENTSLRQQLQHQKQSYETQLSSLSLELKDKESKYESQIKDLRTKIRISTIKVVKPDGTIEERKIEQSEVVDLTASIEETRREYSVQLREQEQKLRIEQEHTISQLSLEWTQERSKLESEIAVLKESKQTSINPRQLRVEAGLMSTLNPYIHFNYDLTSPLFVGTQVERSSNEYDVGIGIGVKF